MMIVNLKSSSDDLLIKGKQISLEEAPKAEFLSDHLKPDQEGKAVIREELPRVKAALEKIPEGTLEQVGISYRWKTYYDTESHTARSRRRNKERTKDCLYQLTKKKYPELFEDLIVSSCTSIWINDLTYANLYNKVYNNVDYIQYMSRIDDKFSLQAYVDERSIPYEKAGIYTMYQIAVLNVGKNNSGMYANGLFVGTVNTYWLNTLSKMTIL